MFERSVLKDVFVILELLFKIPEQIDWKFMATFSLGYTDQSGKVKLFGDKFQIIFNSKDNSDTVSNSSKNSIPQT